MSGSTIRMFNSLGDSDVRRIDCSINEVDYSFVLIFTEYLSLHMNLDIRRSRKILKNSNPYSEFSLKVLHAVANK